MFKCSVPKLGPVIKDIFNAVLSGGTFPDAWAKGMLIMLHKGGNKDDINNYRGISLLSCLGKIFTKIINIRLTNYADAEGLNLEEQAAYRKGYSTTDQIFVLQSLVQKQLCQKQGRYYVLMVDFSKAYDGIPHKHLMYSFIKNGI